MRERHSQGNAVNDSHTKSPRHRKIHLQPTKHSYTRELWLYTNTHSRAYEIHDVCDLLKWTNRTKFCCCWMFECDILRVDLQRIPRPFTAFTDEFLYVWTEHEQISVHIVIWIAPMSTRKMHIGHSFACAHICKSDTSQEILAAHRRSHRRRRSHATMCKHYMCDPLHFFYWSIYVSLFSIFHQIEFMALHQPAPFMISCVPNRIFQYCIVSVCICVGFEKWEVKGSISQPKKV